MPVRVVVEPHVRPGPFVPDAKNHRVVNKTPTLDRESDDELRRGVRQVVAEQVDDELRRRPLHEPRAQRLAAVHGALRDTSLTHRDAFRVYSGSPALIDRFIRIRLFPAETADLRKADEGTRTPDPLLTMEVLYRLSYVGVVGGLPAGSGGSRIRTCVG
jgi:hypothetical protein